uniref:Uncharacterized protein n=1 Tax=Caenorhabditis tropicalis TaxID=1561998 RepID=A0A1I7UCY7_9PELO
MEFGSKIENASTCTKDKWRATCKGVLLYESEKGFNGFLETLTFPKSSVKTTILTMFEQFILECTIQNVAIH